MATVIPNGVDVQRHRRSEALRSQTRDRLGIQQQEIVYLSFSRLDPGMKGDLEALVLHWKRVLANVPHALLVLAGVTADRDYVGHLRQLARATGAANRILVIDNPHELFPDARGSLMSAADVFVHPGTGIEEASPLAVHEAQAHALPVIAARWAGIPEVVAHGETGFLIDTRVAPLRPHVATTHVWRDRPHPSGPRGPRRLVRLARVRRRGDGAGRRGPPRSHGRRRPPPRTDPATSRRWRANTWRSSMPPAPLPRRPGPDRHPVTRWSTSTTCSRLRPAGRLEPGHRLRLSDEHALPLLTLAPTPNRLLSSPACSTSSGPASVVSVADAAAAARRLRARRANPPNSATRPTWQFLRACSSAC